MSVLAWCARRIRSLVAVIGPEGTVIEISDSDVGLRAFARWAEPRDAVRVLFGPDVIMAIETPSRRGWITDEIYFATAWIDRGLNDLGAALWE